jgi:hypothetical protein
MLYYTVVTITTAGYGDIFPHTPPGQMFVIALFGAFAVYLTKQVTHLQKVSALSSHYARAVYSSNKRNCGHLVLMGETNTEGIETFLKECFH